MSDRAWSPNNRLQADWNPPRCLESLGRRASLCRSFSLRSGFQRLKRGALAAIVEAFSMSGRRKIPSWKHFEEAVARFASAMDPKAKVRHNVFLPDSDTHRRRQRDVWIEAKLCDFFPITVHVSCKRLKRKLHEGDIDAFVGELVSSRAHKGVLYSHSGFTQPAIEKAKVRGICCCRLYSDEPGEIPESLLFSAYCCSTRIFITLSPYPAKGWHLKRWEDMFGLQISTNSGSSTVLDQIVARFDESEHFSVMNRSTSPGIPEPFEARIEVPGRRNQATLMVVAHGVWKVYRARIEAFYLNGSYSLTTGDFKGEIATPSIDRFGTDPGPGWELLTELPSDADKAVIVILYGGDTRKDLVEQLALQSFHNGG